MAILLALRKEVRASSDKVNGKGFTPRAEKPHHSRPGTKYRFAASPPAEREGVGHKYAAAFQHAIDGNDTDRFGALCYLAGGKSVMLEDPSAASFCVGDTVEGHVIDEYLSGVLPAR
ncbi:hypothetical protein CYMTET_29135 [Cymbomonas tetramitiformis]|uniref:Uncharacterized protein n=1 Tax=Cymbomonas tetramitiformis TaxID=36881 RepID=A0AAE0FM19_9CHLO|nr:hypothetical protein CYMTET_29135 [Cymbomonas tetramitiformis]